MEKNRDGGYSLILIVVCAALLMLLGGVVTSVSVINVRIKRASLEQSSAFYSCEKAMDEIKTGLEIDIKEEITNVYMELLEHYTDNEYFDHNYVSLAPELQKQVRTKWYLTNCMDKIKERLGLNRSPEGPQIRDALLTYVRTNAAEVVLSDDANVEILDEKHLVLKHVMVSYTKEGRTSNIATDIVITIPDMSFDFDVKLLSSTPNFYEGYSLIANTGIYCESGAMNQITGNVFAGEKGLNVKNANTELSIYTDHLITSGDINVIDQGSLKIGADTEAPVIWGNNIRLDTVNELTEGMTTLTVTGNDNSNHRIGKPQICVKDDLELRAKDSLVTMEGSYIGYSTENSSAGSAILLNGKQSELNLNLEDLFLGGVSYISFPQKRLAEENGNRGVFQNVEYNSVESAEKEQGLLMTGESLSVRNNQAIYLVPNEFMKTGHNPMLYDEYSTYLRTNEDYVKLNELEDALGYSAGSASFTIQPVVYTSLGNNNKIVYVYVHFSEIKEAEKYIAKYQHYLDNQPEGKKWYDFGSSIYNIKGIHLNGLRNIVTAGNVVDYSYVPETNVIEQKLIARNHVSNLKNYKHVIQGREIRNRDMVTVYRNLTETLQKEVSNTSCSLFEYLMNTSAIVADAAEDPSGYAYAKGFTNRYDVTALDDASVEYKVLIADGDINITENMKGIVVATGNVTVNAANVTGMIIAGGTVSLVGSANINKDKDMILDLFQYAEYEFQTYFNRTPVDVDRRDASVNHSTDLIDFSNLITYEQWERY